jgi:glyoxylase-like metal-dependent hydrolase (beta-lactamase superfamily II)
MTLENLTCVDLDLESQTGFRKFISCWLYHSEELSFVVDPGPLTTIPRLLAALHAQQVNNLDYILLTHIHIDHAGGTGELLKKYPQAKVICHPQGINHLVSPEKLWLGTQKVLGRLAEAYGEILAVPEANIGFEEQIGTSGIRSFKTPGHAQHHCCYLFDDLLFGGEVVGVHYPVAKGIYMRPATPPKFIMEIAIDSIQRMIDLQPRYLVIAHYGLVEPAVDYLKIGLQQLRIWVKGVAQSADLKWDSFRPIIFQWLLDNDPNFQNLYQLEDDIRTREEVFLDNSLRGMIDYVAGLSAVEKNALLSENSLHP